MDAATSVITTDFDLVCERSSQGRYDYVIIGSGLGGGILARQLANQKMRVLLVEKGGVTFSTHCLNTSRPHFQIGGVLGPSQDNDVVFNANKAKVQTAAGSDPYVGGPVYCLGGRTTVWGLFVPKVDRDTYKQFFPKKITDYLDGTGYTDAFNLVTHGSQSFTSIYPKSVINASELSTTETELNGALKAFYGKYYKDEPVPTVDIAPVAIEFNSPSPYVFPRGAYSTVDALLDKAHARDPYLTVLLNTEALQVSFNDKTTKSSTTSTPYKASSVTVRTTTDKRSGSLLASKGFILCAGAIGTAQISLNSGLQNLHRLVGKGLTDHEIWGVRFIKEKDETLKDPLKLQSLITVCDEPALLNVVVNANTFFGRGPAVFTPPTQSFNKNKNVIETNPAGWSDKDPQEYDTVNITLEFRAELYDESEVLDVASSDPVIRAKRLAPHMDEKCQKEMQRLATEIRNRILKIDDNCTKAPRLSLAGFGVVAHEVGTMRLQGPDPHSGKGYVVDDMYRVRGFSNLYVCDLSIFPVSPPANPSLTLAALALQLAKNLVKQKDKGAQGRDCKDEE
ncbi:hypothetical protein F5Y10DRAFT_285113 [Nemania abortiva]|nr:hypothetical protein F5Y10DRAFT_285113 [Nemania abortiva]